MTYTNLINQHFLIAKIRTGLNTGDHPPFETEQDKIDWILNCIATAPIVEAAPIRRGKWVPIGLNRLMCSECGVVSNLYE